MIINVENDEMLGRTNDKTLHITLIEQQKEIERLKVDYQQANEVLAEQSEEIERLNDEIIQLKMVICKRNLADELEDILKGVDKE